jgi:peptidoglycan/xylan/chitin deacetylase (PgdA/CDA1 family)
MMRRRSPLTLRAGVGVLVGGVAVACCCAGTALTRKPPSRPHRRLHLSRRLPTRSLVLPILLYHRIDRPLSTLPPITQRLTVAPRGFAAEMSWVRKHGFHPVTQRQLFAALEAGKPLPCRPLLVTFDDGYADVLRYAAPVLRRFGMPATMYVITERPSMVNSGFLSWGGVKELERQGFDIGSHTVTHVPLTSLSNREALEELVRSRRALEGHLGHPVQWLAYPHGAVDARIVQLAARAGYVLGVTTRPGNVQEASYPLELHRYAILDSTDVTGVADVLRPSAVSCRRKR